MKFFNAAAVSAFVLAVAPQALADGAIQHSCAKPNELPVQATSREQERFKKGLDQYRDCMKAFIDSESALARQHSDAAQAAIAEFNAYAKEINDSQGSKE